MSTLAPSLPPVRGDAVEEIPVLDGGGYLAGERGAQDRLAAELRHVFENVGFYFVTNHGVPQALIDGAFAAAKAFHDQPLEKKLALKINGSNVGYLPMRGATTRHSKLNENNKPNLNEAFFLARDLPSDHPDVLAGKPFRCTNQWPQDLPGFRQSCLTYTEALESLARRLIPLYASALDLPENHFDDAFSDPQFKLRMSHYPPQEVEDENEIGLAPHTDTSFMTLLAPNKVAGLAIRLPNGKWVDAPVIDGAILVNGGDLLRRWTNDRFLATPHRVINRSGAERYAIPFFFDCRAEYQMTCLPTCKSADNPPRYDPITYVEYLTWYRKLNYPQTASDDTNAKPVSPSDEEGG